MTTKTLAEQSCVEPNRVFIFTVGGCGEFGMNLTIYGYRGKLYVVDCGLSFAEQYEIGIDAHIPSPSSLESILGKKPDAFFITHGHEDHIGALPYFLPLWDIPTYIGPWALVLLKEKLQSRGDSHEYKFVQIRKGIKCTVDSEVSLDWIHVPHSIPDCFSILMSFGPTRIYHTGDFKTLGYKPYETDLDEDHIRNLLVEGPITALITDSTNAPTPGICPDESSVYDPLKRILGDARGATFVTTFSSNLWRVKTLLLLAQDLGKRVLIFGTSMKRGLEWGTSYGLIGSEASVIIEEGDLSSINRSDLLVIISGCQGEYRSGMHRLVNDEIKSMRVQNTDRVIFSSRSIPGNEKAIAKLISACRKRGAEVITTKEEPHIHVSGHAHSGDLIKVWQLLKPRFYIPVHGTHIQLTANQDLMSKLGDVVPVSNGSVTSIDKSTAKQETNYDIDLLFVDSWSRQPLDRTAMRARHKIGDSGAAVVSGYVGRNDFNVEVEFIGLPFQSESDIENSNSQIKNRLKNLLDEMINLGTFNEPSFNEQTRIIVRRFLTNRFVKKPVVISKLYHAEKT